MKQANIVQLLLLTITVLCCNIAYSEGASDTPNRSSLSCANVRCGHGKNCVMRKGVPKCECPDTVCTAIFEPVCGSDGKTYPSECVLNIETCKSNGAVTKVSDGSCEEVTSTQAPSSPKDNGDNDNEDSTDNEPKTTTPKQSTGPCRNKCAGIGPEVCGSNGKTYQNLCALKMANCKSKGPGITIVSTGPCANESNSQVNCSKICEDARKETCTEEEIQNENTSHCKKPSSLKPGVVCHCPLMNSTTRSSCNRPCPLYILPICGSDGKTYDSPCVMEIAACKQGTTITELHSGACRDDEGSSKPGTSPGPILHCDFVCRNVRNQVDCNDKQFDQTHGSFECLSPKMSKLATRCGCRNFRSACNIFCTKQFQPVCGSDGRTYSNSCELRRISCESGRFVQKVADGHCPPLFSRGPPRPTRFDLDY